MGPDTDQDDIDLLLGALPEALRRARLARGATIGRRH
jgi:hypothetical protein